MFKSSGDSGELIPLLIRVLRPFCFFLLSFVCFGGERVRVASYNVRNYLLMDRLVAGRWVEDSPKPEIENRIVRSIIKNVNADILALQEIGPPIYFHDLWRDLNNSGCSLIDTRTGSRAKRMKSDTLPCLAVSLLRPEQFTMN